MAKQMRIFRKEALERTSSPEQLDELMPVTSPRGWIALAGIAALVVAALLWGVFGRIETTVSGSGALVRSGGVDVITAPADAEVADVLVKVGDSVEAGQELVRLTVRKPGGDTETVNVRSREAGRVLDVAVITGDYVDGPRRKAEVGGRTRVGGENGSMLLSLEFPKKPLLAVLYVSTRDGYRVEPNRHVHITPSTADRYSAHVILGRVKSAARFPATRSAMSRTLQNDDWVNEMLRLGPVLEVIVELPQNDVTEKLFSGTPCRAQITVSRRRPIEFVLPISGGH